MSSSSECSPGEGSSESDDSTVSISMRVAARGRIDTLGVRSRRFRSGGGGGGGFDLEEEDDDSLERIDSSTTSQETEIPDIPGEGTEKRETLTLVLLSNQRG